MGCFRPSQLHFSPSVGARQLHEFSSVNSPSARVREGALLAAAIGVFALTCALSFVPHASASSSLLREHKKTSPRVGSWQSKFQQLTSPWHSSSKGIKELGQKKKILRKAELLFSGYDKVTANETKNRGARGNTWGRKHLTRWKELLKSDLPVSEWERVYGESESEIAEWFNLYLIPLPDKI